MAVPSRMLPRLRAAITSRCSVPSTSRALLPAVSAVRATPRARTFASSSRSTFHASAWRGDEGKGKEVDHFEAVNLSQADYNKFSDLTMETLHDELEALVEEWSPEGSNGWEIEYSSGVLTLSLGPYGTYVINKQPPNKEIWLSSPFSGPARYSFSSAPSPDGAWFYPRDQTSLGSLLDKEIRSVLVREVGKEGEDWEGVKVA